MVFISNASRPRGSSCGSTLRALPVFSGGGPPGDRTPNPRIKSSKFTRAEYYYLGIRGTRARARGITGTVILRLVGQSLDTPDTVGHPPIRHGRSGPKAHAVNYSSALSALAATARLICT
jgi:hypothetical protein